MSCFDFLVNGPFIAYSINLNSQLKLFVGDYNEKVYFDRFV